MGIIEVNEASEIDDSREVGIRLIFKTFYVLDDLHTNPSAVLASFTFLGRIRKPRNYEITRISPLNYRTNTKDEEDLDPEDIEDEQYTLETRSKCKALSSGPKLELDPSSMNLSTRFIVCVSCYLVMPIVT